MRSLKQYLSLRGLYNFLVSKGICKPLEQVKIEQEAIKKAQKIEAAKDYVKFMKTTIFKHQFRNKTWKDFYNSNN